MSDGTHLLIPFAAASAPSCADAIRALRLPHLRRLAARLGEPLEDAGMPDSLSMPHERALARAWGVHVPDGMVPLATLQALRTAHAGGVPAADAWALITPCHWRVGTDHVAMARPHELPIDDASSRAFFGAMQPYFGQDRIELHYETPTQWYARSGLFRNLATASLDRVAGRIIDRWLPAGDGGRPIRRLQQEMQMLLYTMPLNDERQRQGLLPVNSFWVSGTGALPEGFVARPPADLRMPQALRDAALREDWRAWAAAWEALDADEGARLLADLDAGRPVRLTLCGERGSRSWAAQATPLWRRLRAAFAAPTPLALLEGL